MLSLVAGKLEATKAANEATAFGVLLDPAVVTGHARVVRSKPATETEQSIALAVLRNRAAWGKMTPSQKRAAILRGCS